MTGVSHGKKLKLDNLTLPLPIEDNRWFWDPVNDSGLTPSLRLEGSFRRMGYFITGA